MARIQGILNKAKALDIVPIDHVEEQIRLHKADSKRFFKIKPSKINGEELKTLINQWIEFTGSEWADSVTLAKEGPLAQKLLGFSIEVRTHWIARIADDLYIAWRSSGD
jgi:hypothetical protein